MTADKGGMFGLRTGGCEKRREISPLRGPARSPELNAEEEAGPFRSK